jgi:hypothetical protein
VRPWTPPRTARVREKEISGQNAMKIPEKPPAMKERNQTLKE